MKTASGTGPFSPFEWLVAFRYLRARRKEGLISVFAGFSFLGIALGVATLIIVMAVMNGFRQELFNKMLGLNGHIIVHSMEGRFTDYDPVASRIQGVAGVKYALPLIEGQVLLSSPPNSTGALVRGLREADLKKLKAIADNIKFGTLDGWETVPRRRRRLAACQRNESEARRRRHHALAEWRKDRARHRTAGEALSDRRHL
jgi:lipoprotein-releasing system permease protein